MQVSEIAESEQLPVKFLEQIFQKLKEAGMVASVRGKFGGYRLARPASHITIGEVIRLIDGPLAPIGCVSMSAYQKCTCPDEAHCGLRMLMLDVRNAISGILDRYTLADVVAVAVRRMWRDAIPLPFSPEADAAKPQTRLPARLARQHARGATRAIPFPAEEGVVHNLLADYAI